MPWCHFCSTKLRVPAAYPYTCAWLSRIQENYDCRLGIYVGSVMPPDGANTEFGIVHRLIKLGSLTGCDACQKKACLFKNASTRGGTGFAAGPPLHHIDLSRCWRKNCEIFRSEICLAWMRPRCSGRPLLRCDKPGTLQKLLRRTSLPGPAPAWAANRRRRGKILGEL
jgi:hypothetical protein